MSVDRWGLMFLHQKAMSAYINALEEYQREKTVYGFVGHKVAARLDFATKELGRIEELLDQVELGKAPLKSEQTVEERRKGFKLIKGGKQ